MDSLRLIKHDALKWRIESLKLSDDGRRHIEWCELRAVCGVNPHPNDLLRRAVGSGGLRVAWRDGGPGQGHQ